MSRLYLPLCLFNRHGPKHGTVDWDGANYVAPCRYCGKPIRRKSRRTWLRDWMEDEPV
ncbi:MAG TPA: hypothetical protein PKE25_00705 [Novosphingobium sp.]|nr:hypothetical protein [Novosphingobium sp.]